MQQGLNQKIHNIHQDFVKKTIDILIEYKIEPKTFNKNDFLVEQNEIAKFAFFIKSGGIRNFIYDKNFNEITTWFAFDYHVTLSPASYYLKIPAFEMVQAFEISEVFCIEIDLMEKILFDNCYASGLIRGLLSMHIIQMSNRMHSLQSKFAEARYKDLISDFPHILQRAPLTYIASYLGVSLETLSRIRNTKKRL